MRLAEAVSAGQAGRWQLPGGGCQGLLTSTAMWLTTAVWLGSLMSLVWWWSGDPLPPLKLWATGVAESCSTMNAPLTLILTLPGCIMVLSISAVVVAVLGLPICSASTAGSRIALPLPVPLAIALSLVFPLVMPPVLVAPVPAGVAWSPECDSWGSRSVMLPAYGRGLTASERDVTPTWTEISLGLRSSAAGERITGRVDSIRGDNCMLSACGLSGRVHARNGGL